MKLTRLFGFLALVAGMMVGCTPENIEESITNDQLTVSPASQKIAQDGTATFTFTLTLTRGGKVLTLKETTATVAFEATGGTVSPASGTTDENGRVTVTFTTPDPQGFTGGTVKGTVKNVKGIVDQQGNLATATAQVLPMDAVDPPVVDDPIKKAQALQENTYSIQKGSEAAQVFPFPPQYSNWYAGTSYMDGTKQAIHVELMDEDEGQMTMGWMSAEFPPEVANKLTTVNDEFYGKYSWSSAKVGTMRLGQNKMIDCHMGKGGNVKLDGRSQFWLKEKSSSKAYSGEYQLLFVFVFEYQEYDPETDTYLPGGEEYTMCCNATLTELVADLSYISLDCTDNWVVPGQSTTLTAYWTAGASFDWSKLALAGQSCNGYSGEWFSWDASTQTLTATQSAENQQVELSFSYTGTDLTASVSLYNGPGYSSFSLSPQNCSADYILVENDPAYGWGSDTIWLTVDSWTPEGSSFTGYGIEIDPATENYNKLYYNPYGKYVDFKKGIPEGDFDLIFRSVTDHSAKCTIPVKVVHHKVISFQIQPESGATVGYSMGLELSVTTTPEDAYWDWALVELDPDYEGNFRFQGWGGKDEHPKLFVRTSHDPAVMGVQVKFQLKNDNRKYCYIYVTMD